MNPRSRAAGFTLVEVLVALAIARARQRYENPAWEVDRLRGMQPVQAHYDERQRRDVEACVIGIPGILLILAGIGVFLTRRAGSVTGTWRPPGIRRPQV